MQALIQRIMQKMGKQRKVNQTLSQKLSSKKISKRLESKIEKAENGSQYFKITETSAKWNENDMKRETEATVTLETKKATEGTIPYPAEDHNIKLESGKNTAKPARKINTKTAGIGLSTDDNDPSTSKKIKKELSEEKWQPNNWQVALENMRKMRATKVAPVDTMGCHKCADESADEKTQRFHKLVALMLSSQTKDETTYHAMLRLREHNLIPEVISNMKLNVLENILHPVSFFKNKAKYIQQTSKILVEKYNSDIPNTAKELVALPGVGPKMAHICMATAWYQVTGIGVDVHVHRISNRIGWLPKPTKEPEQTRLALESWLPQHLWSEVNHLLVGFGQTICTPVKPKCTECLNIKICPAAAKIIKQ